MSPPKCCVPSCSFQRGQGIEMHSFPNPCNFKRPSELERFRTWVMRIGGDIVGKANKVIYNNARVCHRHFESRFIYPNGRLSRLAIPTLNLPFIVSDEKRLNQWLACVNLESLKVLPKSILSTRSVCHVHFERRFIKPNSRLKYGAYPTLFTPDEITSGVPAQQYPDISLEYQNSRKRHLDHSYFKSDPPVKVPRLTGSSNTNYLATLEKVEGHFDHSYFKAEGKKEKTPSTAGNSGVRDTDVPPARKEDKLDSNLYEDGDAIRTDTCDNDDLPPSPGEEFTTNIVSEIGEKIELENFKKDKIFSWQKSELIEADDSEDPKPAAVPEHPKIPEDLTLSLFCESEPPPLQPAPSESVAVVPEDVEYRCRDCAAVINGFSWWCVRCGRGRGGGALCGACAVLAPHDAHHVLRAPPAATHTQTQAVLAVIREQLLKENLLYGTDDDGVKVEVKQEPEECPLSPPLPTATPDPLAMELHTDPFTEEYQTDLFTDESHTDPFNVESQPDTLNEEQNTETFDVESHTEPLNKELHSGPFTVESYPEDPDPINVEPHLEARTNESLDEEKINHHPFKRPRLMNRPTLKTNTVTSKEVLKHYILKVPARNQGELQTVQTASSEPGISQDAKLATTTDLSGSQTVLNITTSDPSGSQTVVQVTPSDLKRLQTFLQAAASDPRISQDMLNAITSDLEGLETILQPSPSDPSESQTALQENPSDPTGSETVLQVNASDLNGSETVLQIDPSDLKRLQDLLNSDSTGSETVLQVDPSNLNGSDTVLQIGPSDLKQLQDLLNSDSTGSGTVLQIDPSNLSGSQIILQDPSDLKRLQDLLNSHSTGSETVLQVDPSNLSGSQIILQDDPSDQLESQTVLQLDLDDLKGLQDFLSTCSNDPTLSQTVLQIDRNDLRRLQDVLQGTNSDPFRSETVQRVDPTNLNELQTSLQDDPTGHLKSQTVLQLPSYLKGSHTVMQIDPSELQSLPDVQLTTDPSIRTASQSLPKVTPSFRTVSQSLPKATLSDSTGSKSLLKVTPSDRTGSRALPNIIARNRGASQSLKVIRSSLTKSQAPDKIQPAQLRMSLTPQKVKHSDLSGSKTQQKSQPSILRKLETVLKLKKVQNIPKGAPVLKLRQNDPEESRIEITENIPRGKSVPLKVTSEPQATETVIINLDYELNECDVEFLDEEILDSDIEDGLDKEIEHTDEDTVRNIESEVVENIGDKRKEENYRELKETRDIDEYSDTNSSGEDIQVDKNTRNEADSVRDFVDSDVDDSDLDKDYRVEADTIEDDSIDETDVEDIAGRGVRRSTRNATNSEKGPSKETLVKDYRVEEENIPEDAMDDTDVEDIAGSSIGKRMRHEAKTHEKSPSAANLVTYYREEEDKIAEDSMDETDVEDIAGKSVGKRTRNATKTSEKGPSEAILRMLTSKAVVQLEPLTSLDIKKWTASRKRPRKD